MADVATVSNENITPYAPGPRTDAEPPVKRIVVVGGDTAGWMTALLLANSDYGPRLQVTVLESPQVGIIGVGEGSTPWLRGFFDGLGIEESEWMPACNATYKNGIRFDGWSTRPGYGSYFHPFASMLDNMTMTQFIDNVHRRLEGEDVEAHPDRYFIADWLARKGLGPRPRHDFPFDVWYAYHFDATLLGAFLGRKAVERGVRHVGRHVNDVTLNERGDIASLQLEGGETLEADFFVDCTGFASLLIGKALKTPYVSFAENLFNDAAVAMPSPVGDHGGGPLRGETVSTALRHGWAWRIPLSHRQGNGYVYSTAHCSPDAAETELRAHLGLLDDPTPARHLRMRVGRVTRHWNRNCVAIGLSQGFIEPLEATALLFVQRTASMLVKALEQGDLGERVQDAFKEAINERFEGTRDYIVTHYKTNTRTDTDYWRANAANVNLSQPLQRLLRTWLSSRPIAGGLQQGSYGRGYPVMSWYCLLAGMGLFPDLRQEHAAAPGKLRHSLAAIDNLLERSATNFPGHRELLADIPPRPTEASLQLYLW